MALEEIERSYAAVRFLMQVPLIGPGLLFIDLAAMCDPRHAHNFCVIVN